MSDTNNISSGNDEYQLINVIHNNRCMYDKNFFKKGHAILLIENIYDKTGNRLKKLSVIKDPTIQFHVTKSGHTLKHPKTSVEKKYLEEYTIPYNKLFDNVAQLTGQDAYLNSCIGKPSANRRKKVMHLHRDLHGSDHDLADNYISRYFKYHKDNIAVGKPFYKVYADIEVDILDYIGFPDEREAPRPISLISVFDGESQILTQFILPESSLHQKHCQSMRDAFKDIQLLKNYMVGEINRSWMINEDLINEDATTNEIISKLIEIGPERSRCYDINFVIADDEKDLILKFIYYINEVIQPDFVLWWNMRFDIQTIINRLIYLGVDPELAFTCEAFKEFPLADFYLDEMNVSAKLKKDEFKVASPALWLDSQMLYAKLRKGENEKAGYSLNEILFNELDERKLDYEGNISDLLYRAYDTFLAYGAIDVTSLYGLESKLLDVDSVYANAVMTRTRVQKAQLKTITLANFHKWYCDENGYIMSNNRNVYAVKSGKLPGAFVLHPEYLEAKGLTIGGVPSNKIYGTSADIDAESLYPSLAITFNVDPASHVGLIYPCMYNGARLLTSDGSFQSSSNYIYHYMSKDYVQMGNTFMEAPDISELAAIVFGDQ